MRIALSSYRSKPHSGGQGIYVRNLSRELVRLGHEVTVFSGPPYPDLDDGVSLVRLESLDLYNDANPFRHPHRSEFHDHIDVLEYGGMLAGTFPEPRTFAMRLKRELARRAGQFDILHDNQTLAPAILDITKSGLPTVTTIHHPISADRRLEISAAPTPWQKLTKWRWYSFVPMQARVARRSRHIITVSEQSKADIVAEFGVSAPAINVVPVGVDIETFTPNDAARELAAPRLTTITSANVPLKGLSILIDALPMLKADSWSELVVVGTPNADLERRIRDLGIEGRVRFVTGLSDQQLAELISSATVHIVPSLYEGFSLPAVEAMACATPLVATRVGALPQLVHGNDDDPAVPSGDAGILVEPGNPGALAGGIQKLLNEPELRSEFGKNGRKRAESTYSWQAVARATEAVYREATQAGHAEERVSSPSPGTPPSPRTTAPSELKETR